MKETNNIIKIKCFLIIPVLVVAILMGSSCAKSQKTQAETKGSQPVFSTETKDGANTKHTELNKKPESETSETSETVAIETLTPGEPKNIETSGEPKNTLIPSEQKNTESGDIKDQEGSETEQGNIAEKEEKEPLEISGLVLVEDVIPDIEIELKYATKDNFTKKQVYPYDICVLQKTTAMKLKKANEELMEMGYHLKVWDAYRPLSVQKIFWDIIPDSRYVANPNTGGSKHNRGTAVDVTLVDMDGNELEMPTGFDDFSDKAARSNKNVPETVKKNVELLTNVMVKHGFTTISTEWWHYNDSDSANYVAMDVELEEFMQGDAPLDNQGLKIDPNIDKLNNMDNIKAAEQIVLVLADDLETRKATAYTYEKVNGQWLLAFAPIKSVIAKNGLTYDKKEGDKESPIGVFSLNRCFGWGDNPGTKLQYTKFEKNDFWVDDEKSDFYNTYQKGLPNGRWVSAEDLYGIGDTYRFFIVIEYNTDVPVPGKGSAIFMHIWKGEESYTSGCTAMAEENLLKIIKWLDPSKNPLLLQYPKSGF